LLMMVKFFIIKFWEFCKWFRNLQQREQMMADDDFRKPTLELCWTKTYNVIISS
jgi:hypothetical protein